MINWWRQRTLRTRLAAWYAIAGSVLLALFSATLYYYVQYRIGLPLDHELRNDLEVVRKSLTIEPDGRVLWSGREYQTGEQWPPTNPWFELWDERGKLVRRYWPFIDSRMERLPVAPAPGRETISVFSVSPEVRLRVLSIPLDKGGPTGNWMIRVMRIHEPAMNALRSLLIIIGIALPVVIVLLVFGGYAITRRWLNPLDRMVAEANQVGPADLGRRLSISNPHDELGRLAHVFNRTLGRLEDSYVALDRFVADASHELLTPLTTLRSVGEVGLRSARTEAEYQEIIGSMLEEAQRLQQLVEKLLQLARASGNQAVALEEVRIDRIIADCVSELEILAEEKDQKIVLTAEPSLGKTDAVVLRQALHNVVENAVKFSPKGAEIRISVKPRLEQFEITVSDEGEGIAPEFRGRVMDRFFRADSARASGGFGLGLALTKAYMQVLGGHLEYEAGDPRGSRFRLLLPRKL
ncbi:MAG: ATP-binding protein [Nibricoccus sp.]